MAPLLEAIVQSGLCIGCGLCQSLAGAERVRMVMTPEGRERPAVLQPIDEATLAAINDVCPGVTVEGPDPAAHPAAQWHDVWGPAYRMAKGHAADPEVRFRCSASGSLSALAIHLLESGKVAFVLHVAAAREKPMRSERQLSFDRAQVLAGAGSRYGPAAPLTDFAQLLDRGQPFAVIGKPCDIAAIRSLGKRDARVDEFVRFCLSFMCGGASELGKSLDLIAGYGIDEDEVTLLRYRGHGNPGPTRIETRDGRVFQKTYKELWKDEGTWRLQFRCKICADAIGERADVVVSDVWPGGDPKGEDAGFNGFIARTPTGLALLADAERAGAVRFIQAMTFADFDDVQPHQRRKKEALAARLAAMRDAGAPAPAFERLRLEAAAAAAIEREEYEGMRRRLSEGANREPPVSVPVRDV